MLWSRVQLKFRMMTNRRMTLGHLSHLNPFDPFGPTELQSPVKRTKTGPGPSISNIDQPVDVPNSEQHSRISRKLHWWHACHSAFILVDRLVTRMADGEKSGTPSGHTIPLVHFQLDCWSQIAMTRDMQSINACMHLIVISINWNTYVYF